MSRDCDKGSDGLHADHFKKCFIQIGTSFLMKVNFFFWGHFKVREKLKKTRKTGTRKQPKHSTTILDAQNASKTFTPVVWKTLPTLVGTYPAQKHPTAVKKLEIQNTVS